MRYELWLPTRIVTLGASTPGASHPTSHTDCRCRPAGKTWKTLCCLPNLATPNQLSPKWCWIKWTKKIGRDGLKCQPVSLDVSMSQIIQNHSVPQNGMVFSPLLKDHSICASQAAIFARRTSRKLNSTVGAAGPSDLALNFRLCHGNNGNTSNYINQTHVYMYIYYYIYIIILYIYVYIYMCI